MPKRRLIITTTAALVVILAAAYALRERWRRPGQTPRAYGRHGGS